MKIINRRYQLLAIDGEDYYGVNYLALDLANNKENVRVKVLNADFQLHEMIRYLSDYFLQLAAAEHENLLQSLRFDIITTVDNKPNEDKRYFYVTGYFNTTQLLSYHHLDLSERLFVLLEVCYALQFLHFKGIVYRYLTFDNLLITRNDDGQLRVVLKDLVSTYGYLDQGRSEVEKSIQTLAPEVLLRERSTSASDIYALGVMAYFLISGVDCKQHAFERTRIYSNQIEFQHMIENATKQHPEERTQQIQQFIREFTPRCPHPYTFKDKKYYERLNFNVRMVGRDRELSRVRQLISQRLQRLSGAGGLMLSGEPGQGKSRFLREVHYAHRMQGIRCITLEIDKDTDGYHSNFSILLLSLVRQYSVPKTLIDRFGMELVKIVPSLRDMWLVQPSEPLAGEKEILRLNNRIVNFLVEFAQMSPIVMLFDNIEDLNDNEFSILESLIDLNDNLTLFIIASYASLTSKRRDILGNYQKEGLYESMSLESFGIEEAAKQLQEVLFMDKRPLQLATKIISEGSGNPRYIEEVVRSLYMRNFVYIHESRKWFISEDGYSYATIPHTLDEAVMGSVRRLEKTAQKILQAITVFGRPISKAHLHALTKISEADIDKHMAQLLELKILQVRVSDWGYAFDFYNRNLARTFYGNMQDSRKLYFHLKSAAILETIYLKDGLQGELLVRHLIAAKKYLKAIEYAIQLGDRMNALALYAQALEFYHQAYKIFDYVDHHELKARLIKAMADIYYHTGESQLALEHYDALVTLTNLYSFPEMRIDALLKIADIRITRKQLEKIESLFDDIRFQCEQAGYKIGILELALAEFRYLVSIGAFEDAKELMLKSLAFAKEIQNSYYTGRALNSLGIVTLYNNDLSPEGIEERENGYKYFLQAASFLEQTPNCSDLSRAYNNLGVVALNSQKDINKAREYFEKALQILAKHNVIEGKSIYLLNVGETYAIEGNDTRAVQYYSEVEQLCEDSQNTEDLILVTMNLIESNIQLKNYKEAYRYIQKFERDYEPLANLSWDLDIKRFYYLCGLFYLRMRELMLSKAFFDKVSKDHNFLNDGLGRYRYHLTSYVFEHIISGRRVSGEMDFDRLKELQELATSQLEMQFFTDTVLDLCMDLSAMETGNNLSKLIQLIGEMTTVELTETQKIKKSIVLSYMDPKCAAEDINQLLIQNLEKLNMENQMILHMIIGNSFQAANDLFNALQHQLDALDIVHELAMMLPLNLREGYVLSDVLRLKLYESIQGIKLLMVEKSPNLKKILNAPKLGLNASSTLESYFDLGDMDVVFDNEDFKRSILESYSKRHHIRLDKPEHLLLNLSRDQGLNLELAAQYFTQLTLAQAGFIYTVNEYGEFEDVFKSEKHLVPYDIEGLIKQFGDSENGIVIEHKKRLYTERAVLARKSLIFLPIYNQDALDGLPHRRKYDNADLNYKDILGYLYLESEKLLNNINDTTFDEIGRAHV